MSFPQIFPLLSAILTLSLGIFVYFSGKKKTLSNLLFSAFCLGTTLWLVGTFRMFASSGEEAIFWDRIIYIAGVLNPIILYSFGRAFLGITKRKYLLIIGIILAVFFLVAVWTDYFVSGLYEYSWGVHTQARILHHFFLVYFIAYMIFFMADIYSHIRKAEGIRKVQLYYIFTALLLMSIIGGPSFLPAYGISVYPFSYLSGTIFAVIVWYAITRYRLMDVRLVFGRFTIYSLSLLLVIGFSFSLTAINGRLMEPLSQNSVEIFIVIGSIFLFQFFKNLLQRLAEKYYYYPLYNYPTVINMLGRRITQVLDLDKLTTLITSTLVETMKLDRTVVLLRNSKTGKYSVKKNVGFKEENGISLVGDSILTDYLEKIQGPLVYEELSMIIQDTVNSTERLRLESLRSNMLKIEAAVCVPLLIEKKITGMIVLGNKITQDPYSREDLLLLASLANQASIALKNAELYSQVHDLSHNLQSKVNEQTAALRKAYEELRALDKSKSEFISMASHQLRTPLSAIKGYVSMILEGSYGKLLPIQQEKLTNVFLSNERLIKIVDDLLNISKIELGKMELQKVPTQISSLLISCYEEMESAARLKGLEFVIIKPEREMPIIIVDDLKIRQVVTNLLDNAIKYTRAGKITLAYKRTNGHILISVNDTGEGIDKEELEKVFTSFTRGVAGINMFIEGAGLGLYVAKKYLELHNGRIWGESRGRGMGSTFYIELPIV